jgi:hypothetical protein
MINRVLPGFAARQQPSGLELAGFPASDEHASLCVAAIVAAVEAGENVNEVEAAGNTPLHSAAYEGWVEGAELLISLGAKVRCDGHSLQQHVAFLTLGQASRHH